MAAQRRAPEVLIVSEATWEGILAAIESLSPKARTRDGKRAKDWKPPAPPSKRVAKPKARKKVKTRTRKVTAAKRKQPAHRVRAKATGKSSRRNKK
jgi:hypothetical protein